MSDSPDRVDADAARIRRTRGPMLAGLLVSLPPAGIALFRALDRPSDRRAASPRELRHRCLHTDDWPGPDIPDE